MHRQLKLKTAALLTILSVFLTFGMGEDSALAAQSVRLTHAEAQLEAAEAKLDTDRLAAIVKGTARISGCDKLSLLEKPACYRDFAQKALKVGAGVGMFAYGVHYLHKDTVEHFGTVKKEAAGLQKLREAFKEDPTKIADPEYRKQVEDRIRATAAGAQKDIDKLIKDVLETIETILVIIEMTLLLIRLTLGLAQLVGDPKFQAAVKSVKDNLDGIGKALDQMNAGFAQMNRALGDMNDAVDDINKSLGGLNQSINKANKGMDTLNEGIGQANKAVDDMNKVVPGIKKAAEKLREVPAFEFDFSNVGETWSDGSSGLDSEEQQRRMSVILGLMPGIGDGKGIVEAITGKDMMTGEHVDGFDRALGSLAVLRWLKLGGKLIPDDIAKARKSDVVFECNSFPAGTPVLLADGTHKPIEDVRPGDEVLATDPGGEFAELTRPRPVMSTPYTSEYTDKTFVRLSVAGADGDVSDLTSTEQHRYWLPDRQAWVPAGELRAGDRLHTAEGTEATVTGTERSAGRQATYDLDVSGIDSYYVRVGAQDVLVHNCTDLARAERMFPGVAHTLDEHVNVDRQKMEALAKAKTRRMGRPTPNSRWKSADLAQKAVDQLVDQNKDRITKFVQDAGKPGKPQQLTLQGTYGTGSLGDSMDHLGNYSPTTSNGFKVILAAKKGHKPGGFYVLTAYPL
ncbi:pre-toxin TG domain-containing protein [Streptomyces sp. NBC_01619]|uniref:pre-toxin TG domain-containing protein n=1 Tax=Streptomyces sp. NBC_01619 TaxID=2975901 RepID=UPI00224E606C|nr:RNase A-like domain-containing protein [Streptomyces sp. NBC_01619]MCX4511473.1 pre-toxin TG domain-containing protein [Streptomyces sp. NBC_01619]